MKELFKKALVMITSFMVLGLGVTANSHALEDHIGEFRKDVGLTSEMYFNTKFSDYVTGTATIVNLGHSYEAESFTDINDWTADNYTIKSPVSIELN